MHDPSNFSAPALKELTCDEAQVLLTTIFKARRTQTEEMSTLKNDIQIFKQNGAKKDEDRQTFKERLSSLESKKIESTSNESLFLDRSALTAAKERDSCPETIPASDDIVKARENTVFFKKISDAELAEIKKLLE